MVTFTVPKMLRPYFLHHRELLGKLSRAAWETVRDLMVEAAGDAGLRPAMVVSVHTASDCLGWHPHAHALVPRGTGAEASSDSILWRVLVGGEGSRQSRGTELAGW